MAFVPGFEHDCFISYAHLDNRALVPGEPGWIDNFHYALEVRLEQMLGAGASIWRDRKLQGNDDFAETLVERFGRFAVLLSIHSPRYLESEWCRREVDCFLQVGGGALVGTRSRVFKIVKTRVALEDQHPELQKLLGYDFFAIDEASDRAREFRQDVGQHKDIRYWTKLDDLAYDLARLLQQLREDVEAQTPQEAKQSQVIHSVSSQEPDADLGPTPSEAAPQNQTESQDSLKAKDSGQSIYLAPVTSDIIDTYEELKREYELRGCQILPDRSPPTDAPSLESFTLEQLGQADLAVHLIGKNYGLVPEAADRSITELQLETTRQANATRLAWIPTGAEPNSDKQAEVWERLRNSNDASMEVLETDIDELKRSIDTLLERSKTKEDLGGPRCLYLVYADEDYESIGPIEDELFDDGHDVLTALIDGSEAERLADHRENLERADAVLIIYGACTEAWFKQTLRSIDELLAEQTEGITTGVYVGPPESRAKQRIRSRQHRLLSNSTEFSVDDIRAFLQTPAGVPA